MTSSAFSWQCQYLCWLSLANIIDWKVVVHFVPILVILGQKFREMITIFAFGVNAKIVWGLNRFQVRSQDTRQQCPTGYGEVLGQDSFQGRPLGRHPFRWATGKKRRKCERKALLWMPRQIRRFLQTSTCRGTIPDVTHFTWLLRLLLLNTINVFVLKGSFDIIRQASLLSTYFRHTTPKACWIDETSIGFIAFSRNFFRLDVYL